MTSVLAVSRDRYVGAPLGAARCPHLASVTGCARSLFPCGYLCSLRPPGRGTPSADELAWLCTNGHFHACPTHRLDRGEP